MKYPDYYEMAQGNLPSLISLYRRVANQNSPSTNNNKMIDQELKFPLPTNMNFLNNSNNNNLSN